MYGVKNAGIQQYATGRPPISSKPLLAVEPWKAQKLKAGSMSES